MKRITAFVIVAAMCLPLTACAPKSQPASVEVATEPVTEAPTPQAYYTMGMTIEGFIDKLNTSGDFSKTWSKDYSTYPSEENMTFFIMDNEIIGCQMSGDIEATSKEIIDLEIRYYSDTNDATASAMGCAGAAFPMKHILNIDRDKAIELWTEAENASTHTAEYNGYRIVVEYDTNYNLKGMVTKIEPINKKK